MAGLNLSGITHEVTPWSDIYTGERETLVSAGLAEPEWFPGSPECPRKRSYTTPDGRVRISRRGRKSYDLTIYATEEEGRRRYEHEKSLRAAREAQADLAQLPSSGDAFKRGLSEYAKIALGLLRAYAENGNGGYRASNDIKDAIDIATSQVLAAIGTGSVTFSKKARIKEEQEILAKREVIVDPAARSFIDKLMSGGPAAES